MSIQAVQSRLTALGYSPGPADGIMGKNTMAALQAYAWDRLINDLPVVTTPVVGQPKATRPISEIIIHCTATREGQEVSVAEITAWHKARGFITIGYHYVVHLDGSVERGRDEAVIGAHVEGHNSGTLGVVYVGGVEADGVTPKDTRTPAQREALMATVRALCGKYPAIKKVSGHNFYAAKSCPCFDVQKDPLHLLV